MRILPIFQPMKVIGHRGASDSHPENTFASVKRAFEIADGAEIDIQLSIDEVIFALHDDTLHRTHIPGTYPIELLKKPVGELDFSAISAGTVGNTEYSESPVQLDDVIKLQCEYINQKNPRDLLIEVKGGDTRMIEPLARSLESFEKKTPGVSSYWKIIGFDFSLLTKIRDRLPGIHIAWVIERKDANHSCIDRAKRAGFNGIDFEAGQYLTSDLVTYAHQNQLKVISWVNGDQTDGKANAIRFKDLGVDEFTSNLKPDMLTTPMRKV